MSSPGGVRTTRTGRRIVPTAAAIAAEADKAEQRKEKEAGKPSGAGVVEKVGVGSPVRGARAAGGPIPKGKVDEKEKVVPSPTPAPASAKKDDAEGSKARRGRSVPKGSETPERLESKKLKLEDEGGEEQDISQMETQEVTDDSQIFEAVAKMNAESTPGNSLSVSGTQVITATVIDDQQRSAIDSILPENCTVVGTVVQNADGILEVKEFIPEGVAVEVNPPWNEPGCLICNADISLENPAVQLPKSEQLKEFFLEFFSVGDQISLEDENAFPFCAKCAEEMDSLLTVSQNVETMHKQFNKVRDSMAKKAIKTFLSRTKPTCLEEDAKAENFGFLDEDQKRTYKDQMFHLWKSRYELVQPGPKTPIMIRSMDSRGRVTVVRLNSSGQAVPDRFGSRAGTGSLGGIGRLLTNGDDEDSGGGLGGALALYQCKDCPKAFSTKSMLAYHERVHTGELPYECDQCGKAFSVPHYLMTHMKTHSGEKPYKCNECGKGFAQRGGLVTHSLVHTGAKPFACQVCGKSFRQKYHLTQHNLIHSGVKPFSCELCGKAFNVKMNLKEHMRRHTGDRPYKCPYCTTVGFFRKKMLREHITRTHPQRPMPEELMGPEPSSSYGTGESSIKDEEDDEDLDDIEEGEIVMPDNEEEEEVAA